MKKTLALILTAAMGVTALGACSNTTETSVPETQAETVAETTAEQTEATAAETTAAETEATAAETTAAAFDPTITSDLQNLFDTGMEGLVGVNYTPVYYMGIPSDDPLGNTFLCMATAVVPDAEPYWALVTMEDVGSEVTITEIKTIDYGASSTASEVVFAEGSDGPALGAYEEVPDAPVPDEFQNVGGYVFYDVLATQVVSGMNYCCLTQENGQWSLVTVYVNTQGEAEVTNVAALNF